MPKNLLYQFHNIANIYFLFLIILGVRPYWRAESVKAKANLP